MMGAKVKTTRHGYLAFRLIGQGIPGGRTWEGILLKDTPENRKLAEAKALLIDAEMKAGSFNYLKWFPHGNKAHICREQLQHSRALDLSYLRELGDTLKGELDRAGEIHGVKTYVVYFPAMSSFKIGKSSKLRARLSDLRVSCLDGTLWLVACLRGDHESELHERFAQHRQHGDWFK
ncbi:MAG: DUF3596 domain-containing protein [Deltaproteobacteria bacterium]|nr:DUF3596 domain-containing protein [Deltaproteobacteria bacterium]